MIRSVFSQISSFEEGQKIWTEKWVRRFLESSRWVMVPWFQVVATMRKINGPFQGNILKGESPGFSNLWHEESCGRMVKKCPEWSPGPGLKHPGEGWCRLLRWAKLGEDGLCSIMFFLLKEKVAVLESSISRREETKVSICAPTIEPTVGTSLTDLLSLPEAFLRCCGSPLPGCFPPPASHSVCLCIMCLVLTV